MKPAKKDRSGVSARTKRAILDAAAPLIARDPSVSMADIADAAHTVRSTVYRHFPERNDLLQALREYADYELTRAYDRASAEGGNGRSTLLRLCQEYFERADLMMSAYSNLNQAASISGMSATDVQIGYLIQKGYDDGSIDTDFPPLWIELMLWSAIYTAWLTSSSGKTSKHSALTLLTNTFDKILSNAKDSR